MRAGCAARALMPARAGRVFKKNQAASGAERGYDPRAPEPCTRLISMGKKLIIVITRIPMSATDCKKISKVCNNWGVF